jgi:hypothetical protein
MTDPNEMLRRTDDIRERYEHFWRDKQAQDELKALWGDADQRLRRLHQQL